MIPYRIHYIFSSRDVQLYTRSSIGNSFDYLSNSYRGMWFLNFFFFKYYLRMTLMQSKDNKMSNFCCIYDQSTPQALKDSLKNVGH